MLRNSWQENEFINNFDRTTEFCVWDDEKKALGLPLYLKGYANVWYNSLKELLTQEIIRIENWLKP